MMQKRRLGSWFKGSQTKYFVSVTWIIVVLIFLASYLSKNIDAFAQYHWDLNIFWLFLAFIMAMIRRLVAAFRWVTILNYNNSQVIPPGSIAFLKSFFYSNLANYIPGSIWAVASRIELTRRQGVPVTQSAFSIGFDIGINLIIGFAIGVYSLLKLTNLNNSIVVLISTSMVLLTTLLIYPKTWTVLLIPLSKVFNIDSSRIEIYSSKNFILWLLSISTWVFGGFGLFCLVKAVYLIFPWAQFLLLLSASAVGWTAGFLAIWTPSGIGVREGVTVGLLLSIIPEFILLVVVIAERILMLMVDLIWAGIFMFGSRLVSEV
jgi:hypothetical protein